MADDRSAVNSAGSQRVSTMMTIDKQSDSKDPALFNTYLMKPEQVQPLWEAADLNAMASKLILEHVEDESERTGQNWHTWDEYEDRFEANELKWISDYVVRNLVFVRSDLCIEEPEAICHLMHVLWLTLDLLNPEPAQDLADASENRFSQLKSGLKRLFIEKIISKEQVQKTLDYAKRTVFGHLQLYLTCMAQKKQQSRIKRIEIFTETPQAQEVGDLEANCRELLETGRADTPEDLRAGETALDGEQLEEDQKEEEQDDDIVDPNDPLYGLEARLAQLDLDEASRQVLKAKLVEASSKIKDGLEKRQADLDAKLAAMGPGQKKR